ncbi:hypothetical protein pqer_cds_910 [Pandoravirus quercus]|uniref:Transmembrane protein n=1 Tax=Pandoravirus quercus TaxID=2107709 RepID=A0A2U7UAA9_9VIRU|nr:hypothetical protein pqer_cds_910 [Pandoravirus quercus]AVK75332.1 hypothetical protein pqer_cds_910 [Pandoravirus quercus]
MSSDSTSVTSASLTPPADAILDSRSRSPLASAEPQTLPEATAPGENQPALSTIVDETVCGQVVDRVYTMRACRCASAPVPFTKPPNAIPTREVHERRTNLWGRLLWTVLLLAGRFLWTALLLAVLVGPTLVRHSFAPTAVNEILTDEVAAGMDVFDVSSAVTETLVDDDNNGDANRCQCMCPAKGPLVVGTLLVGPEGSRCVCACDQPRPAHLTIDKLISWVYAEAVAHGPLVLGIVAVSIFGYTAAASVL